MKTSILWYKTAKQTLHSFPLWILKLRAKGRKRQLVFKNQKQAHMCSGSHFKTSCPTVLAFTAGHSFD